MISVVISGYTLEIGKHIAVNRDHQILLFIETPKNLKSIIVKEDRLILSFFGNRGTLEYSLNANPVSIR